MRLTAAQRRVINWAAIAAVAAVFVWLLAPVLAPFAVGAGLAYALHPPSTSWPGAACRACSPWSSSRSAPSSP
jgi:hypothetical protein